MLERGLYALGGAAIGAGGLLLGQYFWPKAKPARKSGKRKTKKRTSGK